jgi:hypothetical protein
MNLNLWAVILIMYILNKTGIALVQEAGKYLYVNMFYLGYAMA